MSYNFVGDSALIFSAAPDYLLWPILWLLLAT